MKRPQIVSLFALVVSAAGVVTVLADPSILGSSEVAGAEDLAAESREIHAPLTDLELQSEHLQRAAVMEAPGAVGDAATVDGAAVEDTDETPRAATLAELQEFREYADSAISEIRQQRAADELRELEKRIARLDQTIPALEKWLELSPEQSDKMRSALLSRFDREAEYLRLRGEGADEEILDELKGEDLEALRTELSGFLTRRQLEAYLSRE